MAAIALSGATSSLIKSAWMAFVNVPIPALVSGKPPAITLALDSASGWKTPDISGSPSPTPFFLGCTKAGWAGASSGGGTTETTCDEFTSPVFVDTEAGSNTFESELFSVLNANVLNGLFGMTDLANSAGNLHYSAPASFTAPEISFMLIGRRLVSGTYKYTYLFAPSAKQTAPFGQGNHTRTEVWNEKLSLTFQGYAPWSNVPYVIHSEN